ncbi:hypothetical protein Shyhy01_70740 [Streptomyces hygroscopicus subsp. hygroscopicus]|nr:hypothetical protein Shyhy01_70740 [Streptomyces hygroscopicus subsp. hygroscopicus]
MRAPTPDRGRGYPPPATRAVGTVSWPSQAARTTALVLVSVIPAGESPPDHLGRRDIGGVAHLGPAGALVVYAVWSRGPAPAPRRRRGRPFRWNAAPRAETGRPGRNDGRGVPCGRACRGLRPWQAPSGAVRQNCSTK